MLREIPIQKNQLNPQTPLHHHQKLSSHAPHNSNQEIGRRETFLVTYLNIPFHAKTTARPYRRAVWLWIFLFLISCFFGWISASFWFTRDLFVLEPENTV